MPHCVLSKPRRPKGGPTPLPGTPTTRRCMHFSRSGAACWCWLSSEGRRQRNAVQDKKHLHLRGDRSDSREPRSSCLAVAKETTALADCRSCDFQRLDCLEPAAQRNKLHRL